MDAGLDQNEAEFAVLVLAVALEVLADGDGLRAVVSTLGHGGRQRGLTFLMSM